MGNSGSKSTDAQPRLRVLVVDDDPLVRRMIKDALRPADILVVGEAHNGRDALGAARYYKPDVILLDVVLPGIDGITALEQMVADDQIDAKIVVLSVRGERDLGYLALRKGAAGYLNKELDLSVLPRVLRDVADGGAAISRSLTAELARRLRELPDAPVGMRPVKSVLTHARMGNRRPALPGPLHLGDRGHACPLRRNRSHAREEHHAQAEGPLACGGDRGGGAAARRRFGTAAR